MRIFNAWSDPHGKCAETNGICRERFFERISSKDVESLPENQEDPSRKARSVLEARASGASRREGPATCGMPGEALNLRSSLPSRAEPTERIRSDRAEQSRAEQSKVVVRCALDGDCVHYPFGFGFGVGFGFESANSFTGRSCFSWSEQISGAELKQMQIESGPAPGPELGRGCSTGPKPWLLALVLQADGAAAQRSAADEPAGADERGQGLLSLR